MQGGVLEDGAELAIEMLSNYALTGKLSIRRCFGDEAVCKLGKQNTKGKAIEMTATLVLPPGMTVGIDVDIPKVTLGFLIEQIIPDAAPLAKFGGGIGLQDVNIGVRLNAAQRSLSLSASARPYLHFDSLGDPDPVTEFVLKIVKTVIESLTFKVSYTTLPDRHEMGWSVEVAPFTECLRRYFDILCQVPGFKVVPEIFGFQSADGTGFGVQFEKTFVPSTSTLTMEEKFKIPVSVAPETVPNETF